MTRASRGGHRRAPAKVPGGLGGCHHSRAPAIPRALGALGSWRRGSAARLAGLARPARPPGPPGAVLTSGKLPAGAMGSMWAHVAFAGWSSILGLGLGEAAGKRLTLVF